MTAWFILARAVHLAACLLFFGVLAFDRLVAAPVFAGGPLGIADRWQPTLRRLILILPPVIFLSGLAWFALVAMTMSGEPLQYEILRTVWNRTQFGAVWKVRLLIWFIAAASGLLHYLRPRPAGHKAIVWVGFLSGGILLGSLAWAGHGQEDSPWHLFADFLHLLIAGIWPAGLLPFALLLRDLRRTPDPPRAGLIAALVRRFSALSLGAVALLSLTGLINSWFLVGSFNNLLGQPYGRWLLAKIILFGLAVSLGAVNLLRLIPRLLRKNAPTQDAESAARGMQFNVGLELWLGTIIVVIVAILGILPPASH